ncbi:P-loop NTPase [candidate division KSB1 bacterium]|nr:P-loop NTPase [candidate division KSB1 bacterium]
MQVFVKIRDQQYGPYTSADLEKLVQSGQFKSDDLVFSEDQQEWIRAEDHTAYQSLFQNESQSEKKRTVFAVGGGKGGVGKTVITASLGVGLASLGKQVVLVDADLGGANLHTCMGILEPKFTFYHFYSLQRDTLEDILLDTPIENLRLISGTCGTLGLANPRYSQKQRFISSLKKINADYLLLDLGAGSSYNVIDFFLAADDRIVVTTPEPMAVQETFNFVKIAIFRALQRLFRDNQTVLSLLDNDMFAEPGRLGTTMQQLLHQVEKADAQAGKQIGEFLDGFRPRLILNMVHDSDEAREGVALKTAVLELLGVQMEFLGVIEYDESVRNSVKELKPFLINDPRSKASRSLAKLISVGLLKKTGWKGFRERRRVIRQVADEAQSYPTNQLKESDVICSVNCFYWGDCDFQNGGYPCPVRHLDPIFKK